MQTQGRRADAAAERAPRVLVVEDEHDVAELLRHHLARAGFAVLVAPHGDQALRVMRGAMPDVVLLDLMLPRLDGWEVCRRLRQEPETRAIPVIIVSGRADEADKIIGFELGADDYVTKPFSPREIVARVRAVTRRTRSGATTRRPAVLRAGHLEIDRERFEVRMQGQPVELTRTEFELLATLVAAPGRVFGREELLDLVWGRDGFVEPRTVDTHLARLRAKFGLARLAIPPIETVRGVGYRLSDS